MAVELIADSVSLKAYFSFPSDRSEYYIFEFQYYIEEFQVGTE